jgi:hypothetical protein
MRAATASSDPAMAIKTLPGAKGSSPMPAFCKFSEGAFAAGQNTKPLGFVSNTRERDNGPRGSSN